MNVGQVCSRDVDLAEMGESVRDAARRMLERRVGTLVVIDSVERPVGLVTDRDLAIRVLAAAKDPAATQVQSVVSAPVRTVREDASAADALAAMRAAACRRLPVVDAAGKLIGIVSLDDVLSTLAEELVSIARLLEREAPHPPSDAR